MTRITVAVPVYNGADYLERCLECLRTQTFHDFQVLIFDNASTDATPDIAKRYVATDKRFSYVRQTYNKDAGDNFLDALAAADTEFFLWRAHDDVTDANYIEVLFDLFDRLPHINIAVPQVRSVRPDGEVYGFYPLPDLTPRRRTRRIANLLRDAHPSWFYAMWRTAVLRETFAGVWQAYPYAWASDHLALFPHIIDEKIAGSSETTFVQLIQSRPVRIRPPVNQMIELRRKFSAFCLSRVHWRDWPLGDRLILRYLIWRYTSHRCYGHRKIFRRYLREILVERSTSVPR